MKLYYIIRLLTYFILVFTIFLITITSSSAIWKCGYRVRHNTNSRTVIQTTKKCTTLALQCVFTHILDAIYLYISDSNWAVSCRANVTATF